MNTLLWKVAALLISVPTTLPFSDASRDAIDSPIPGHKVAGITCSWGKTTSQWLTITWWQDTLPPYPGQPIVELETWQVKFLNRISTASRVSSAGSLSIGDGDNSYLLFASNIDSHNAYITITASGLSKEHFTTLVQSIRLHDKQRLSDDALDCESVKS